MKTELHQVMGLTVQARPTTMNVRTCAGCAAANQQLMLSERNTLCKAMPPCFAGGRADGLNVVYVAVTKP